MFRLSLLFAMVLTASAFAEEPKWITDPYPLITDPTGASLVDVAKPVVVLHDGRELRFATQENADTFAADPEKYLAEVDKQIIEHQSKYYPLTTCVVSGEALGDMGDPVLRVDGNRLVKFCCGGCVGKFTKDPTKFIHQLDEAVIAQQSKTYAMDTCPVSGEKLDGMGEPVNYVIANRLVKFCCGGCVGKFKANPAQYLAKLPPVKVEEQP